MRAAPWVLAVALAGTGVGPAAAATDSAPADARPPLSDWVRPELLREPNPGLRRLLEALREGRASKPLLREATRLWQMGYPFEPRLPEPHGRRLAASRAPGGPGPGAGTWSLAGPTNIGGRTSAVGFFPGEADRALVGAAGGGVWLWQRDAATGASTWTPLFDQQPTLSIGAVAIDPTDAERFYVGTGEMNFSLDEYDGVGIIRSRDGGRSWLDPVALPGANRIGALVVRPDAPATVFAGTSAGLFRSSDSGSTWTAVLGGGAAVAVVLDPARPGTILVAVQGEGATAGGLWRSTSGGGAGSFVRLTGSGVCTLPALEPDVRTALAATPAAPGVLYAALGRGTGEIWRSDDGGDTWCARTAPPNLCGGQCWYDLVIAVDPLDPEHLLAGGIGLWRSRDGGRSWSRITPVHVDHHALAFAPGGERVALDGNDGGLARLELDGATARVADLSQGYASAQLYGAAVSALEPAESYGATQDNAAFRLLGPQQDAAGMAIASCGDAGSIRAHPALPGRVFWTECPGDGRLHVVGSDDGGATAVEIGAGISTAEGSAWAAPLELVADGTLLTATSNRVWRSTNPGAPLAAIAWRPIGSRDLTPAGGSITTLAADPRDARVVWAGTSHGEVWRTGDGGATWDERWLASGGRARWVGRIALDPHRAGRAWLALGGWQSRDSGGHVFSSDDAGASWQDRSGNLPDVPVAALTLDPASPGALWAGTWDGLFESRDEGVDWRPVTEVPRVGITDLALDSASGTLRIATHGRGIWQTTVERCPELAIASSGQRCSGEAVTLAASAGFTRFDWSTGATTPVITVAPERSTVYCLEANDAAMCADRARATVAAPRFVDVSCGDPFFAAIAELEASGVTAGCALSPPRFCPGQAIRRAEMAVFLLRALGVHPPPVTTSCFADVAPGDPFAPWICELARRGITAGCASAPARFCPDAPVTRAHMAVFLLRAVGVYPPEPSAACFGDVERGDPFAPWICGLAARGITGGCATVPPSYCPAAPVTRAQMALFLSRAFALASLAPCATEARLSDRTARRRER